MCGKKSRRWDSGQTDIFKQIGCLSNPTAHHWWTPRALTFVRQSRLSHWTRLQTANQIRHYLVSDWNQVSQGYSPYREMESMAKLSQKQLREKEGQSMKKGHVSYHQAKHRGSMADPSGRRTCAVQSARLLFAYPFASW
jgi:hypothetical protein